MVNGKIFGNELMAFRIPRDIHLERDLCVLQLPNTWREKLTALWATSNEERGPRIPFRSLADTLKLLAPDLVYIENSLYQNRIVENGWLYGSMEIDVDVLFEVVASWIRHNPNKTNRNLFEKKADTVIRKLDSSDLKWERVKINFGRFEDGFSEVPNISVDKYFESFTDVVCASLMGREFAYGNSGGVLRFVRAFDGRNSHLISWPPEESEGTKSGIPWRWSYVIKPQVYLVPGSHEPFFNMGVSIRRWVSSPLSYDSSSGDERHKLPLGKTNVYAKVVDNWIPRLDAPRSLVQVPLRVIPQSYKLVWASSIEEILTDLRVRDRLPNVWELVRAPRDFLDGAGSQFGITYSEQRMPQVNHSVSQGVPLIDRRHIFEAVASACEALGMEHIGHVRKLNIPPALPNRKSNLRQRIDEQLPTGRVDAIRSELGDRLRIEVLTMEDSREAMLERIRDSFRYILGVERFDAQGSDAVFGGDSVVETCDMVGLHVELVSKRLGEVGALLADETKKSFDSRVELIRQRFPNSCIPTLSIVELENHRGQKGDPKNVLRHGLALAGRNTQFITPLTEGEKNEDDIFRVRNAVLDIIRQTGMLPGNITEPRKSMAASVPPNLSAMALYVHRVGDGVLPVFTHIAGAGYLEDDGRYSINVRFPVLPGHQRVFLPYRDAQLALGAGEIWRPITKKEVPAFVNDVFSDLIREQEAPLIFIGDASNLSGYWKWFQDGVVQFDKPKLPSGRNLAMMDGLRIVRVRSDERYVPQWFNSQDSLRNSLLELPGKGRAFYSIANKARTIIDYPGQRMLSKRDNPFDVRVAPRAKEIILLHKQDGDVPSEWAIVVHRMREMAVTYDDALSNPLPLFLAEQVKEYIEAPWMRKRRRQ